MIKLGDVAVGYTVLFVLLVIILIVASVRIVATFKILNRRHTRGKDVADGRHPRDEHEDMPMIQ